MKYLTKSANVLNSSYNFQYQKPAICPHCGYGTDATISSHNPYSFNNNRILFFSAKCTACGKTFLFACETSGENLAKNVFIYPNETFQRFENPRLSAISERFIDMYNQALAAEFIGNIELAAIGYRSALEFLVKDYAINELNQNPDSVGEKKLFTAIKDYLKQEELINTADVIRILGNDYTHYERKYPEYDFDLLKGYMKIFIDQIEVLYMIKHPPLSRNSQ